MGFFSCLCPGCNHSIRSYHAVKDDSEWMMRAVALNAAGSRIVGEYDGYGRVGDGDLELECYEIWHYACWKIAGKPEFSKPSAHAADQGYFVGKYDPKEPKTPEDLLALKRAAKKAAEDRRKEMEEYRKAHPDMF